MILSKCEDLNRRTLAAKEIIPHGFSGRVRFFPIFFGVRVKMDAENNDAFRPPCIVLGGVCPDPGPEILYRVLVDEGA